MADTATRDDDGPITGINVTPLVDVTLVLLIVFLVTAKTIVSQGIPFTVPQTKTSEAVAEPLVVTVDPSGRASIAGRAADDAAIVRAAREAHARDPNARAVIRASADATHGAVVRAMDALREGEVTRIAFAVERRAP